MELDTLSHILQYIKELSTIREILLSLSVIFVFGFLKLIIRRNIEKNKSLTKGKRQLQYKKIRDYLNLLLIVVIVFLWFTKIQGVMVSLLAIAAALVLATKELIMCLTGGFLVKFNKHFKIGDRIEIDGNRGFVLQQSLTTTRLLEIGPEKNSQQTTGNIITIPNSLMLSKSLRNESFFTDYTIKAFSFRVNGMMPVQDLEKNLLLWGQEISKEYIEIAKKQIANFCEKEGIEIPSVEPKTKLVIDDKNEIFLMLKMPVRNANIADVEQKLLRKYLQLERG